MKPISQEQMTQIYQENEPFDLLKEYGYSPLESDTILWQLFVDDNAPKATVPMLRRLLQSFQYASAELQARFLAEMLQSTHFTYESYQDRTTSPGIKRSRILAAVRQFCKRDVEEVCRELHVFPARYYTYILYLLAKEKEVDSLSGRFLPFMLEQWYFPCEESRELFSEIYMGLGNLHGLFSSKVWAEGSVRFLTRLTLPKGRKFLWPTLGEVSLETLIEIGKVQHYDLPGFPELIVRFGEEAIPALEAALLPALESVDSKCGEDGWPGYALMPAYCVLLQRSNRPVPIELEPWLWHLLAGDDYENYFEWVGRCKDWMLLLDTERAAALIMSTFHFSAFSRRFFGLIEEPTLPARVVALICARDGEKPGQKLIERGPWLEDIHIEDYGTFKRYIAGVVACGERIVPALVAALKKDYTRKTLLFLLEALQKIGDKKGIRAMKPFLLHKSKPIRDVVCQTLSKHRNGALKAAKNAILSPKKPIRQTGLELLFLLPANSRRKSLVEELLQETSHKDVKEALASLPSKKS